MPSVDLPGNSYRDASNSQKLDFMPFVLPETKMTLTLSVFHSQARSYMLYGLSDRQKMMLMFLSKLPLPIPMYWKIFQSSQIHTPTERDSQR
jgi:hypothetical protein